MKPSLVRALAASLFTASSAGFSLAGCGSDQTNPVDYGSPPDAALFDAGNGGHSPYGGDAGPGDGGPQPEAGPPSCPDSLKLCGATFTLVYNGEQSVELRGDYRAGAWTKGDAMTHTGAAWTVKVP